MRHNRERTGDVFDEEPAAVRGVPPAIIIHVDVPELGTLPAAESQVGVTQDVSQDGGEATQPGQPGVREDVVGETSPAGGDGAQRDRVGHRDCQEQKLVREQTQGRVEGLDVPAGRRPRCSEYDRDPDGRAGGIPTRYVIAAGDDQRVRGDCREQRGDTDLGNEQHRDRDGQGDQHPGDATARDRRWEAHEDDHQHGLVNQCGVVVDRPDEPHRANRGKHRPCHGLSRCHRAGGDEGDADRHVQRDPPRGHGRIPAVGARREHRQDDRDRSADRPRPPGS